MATARPGSSRVQQPFHIDDQHSEEAPRAYVLPDYRSDYREALCRDAVARRKKGREKVCKVLDAIVEFEKGRTPSPSPNRIKKLTNWKDEVLDLLDATGTKPEYFNYDDPRSIVSKVRSLKEGDLGKMSSCGLYSSSKGQIRAQYEAETLVRGWQLSGPRKARTDKIHVLLTVKIESEFFHFAPAFSKCKERERFQVEWTEPIERSIKGAQQPGFSLEDDRCWYQVYIVLEGLVAKAHQGDHYAPEGRGYVLLSADREKFLNEFPAEVVLGRIGLDVVPGPSPKKSRSRRVVNKIQALTSKASEVPGTLRRRGKGYDSIQSLSHRTLSSRQVGRVYGFESLGAAGSGGHYF